MTLEIDNDLRQQLNDEESSPLPRERAEQVNRVLYAIANAVNTTPDLDELYQVIHQTLSSIIDVTNFFIAIVNSQKKTLYFPYSVDMEDDDFSPITDFDTSDSLTGLVVLRKKPILLHSKQLQERAAQEGIWGPVPAIWMGVPLIIRDEVIGVIAVQSYTNSELFSEGDLQILMAVSDQIALAIDRKQSLDDLQRSEQSFRQLFEQSNDAIFIVDLKREIRDCNHRASEMLGYKRSELLKMRVADLYFQEDAEIYDKAFKEAAAKGHLRLEAGLKTATGSRIETEISARLVDRNQGTIQAIVRDITERKRAERVLLENEKKYRNLFYNAQVGLFRTSPAQDTFLECNDALAKMAGYESRQEFLKTCSLEKIYVGTDDRQNIISMIRDKDSITNFETPLRLKNGDIGWFRCTASYYPDEDWIEGVIVDITEMRNTTEEKQLLQKKLEQSQKMEALGMLAGGVAHDLNNILAGIISYPELLLLQHGENQELRKPLEAILESGNRAAMIVADMLAIARSSASVMENRDLHELIGEYLNSPEFHKLESLYPNISIKTAFEAPRATISCSSVHIKKCLMNLVVNGFEAINGSGIVTLTTALSMISAENSTTGSKSTVQEAVCLTVHDTGSGIGVEDVDHIFEPFYTKKMMGRSGTGLGLTVVWNTMQDHGGIVQVESSGLGTCFKLTFPIASASEQGEAWPIKLSQMYKGAGETILVVDDEPELRDIACSILSTLGYKPHAVCSGEEALHYLSGHSVDLLILDMLMEPGMNGAETYAKILILHPNQKAIIASGFSESDDVKKALQLGVGSYLRKPYTIEQLSHVVRKILYPVSGSSPNE